MTLTMAVLVIKKWFLEMKLKMTQTFISSRIDALV